MMKNIFPSLLIASLFFLSCSKIENEEDLFNSSLTDNKVLLLKVDYLTNTFEGGKELTFKEATPTFTITTAYQSPGDFGSIKFTYKELNETIFDGTIIWMGKGQINFPTNLVDAKNFKRVNTEDFVQPMGFENIFPTSLGNQIFDYLPIWIKVQQLAKVREFLKSNPKTTAKVFLYTPSVGIGNPADWDWIILLKN